MNTEHIFQVAVSIDDEGIRESIKKRCAEDVSSALEDGFIKKGYRRTEIDYKLMQVIEDVTTKFCEEHKDEFIRLLVDEAADRIMRSKKMKDQMTAAIEGGQK